MFGQITIDGKNYIERFQAFPIQVSITSNGQLLSNQSFVFPGVANFLLKALTRQVISTNNGNVTGVYPFLFKWGNSDGNTWYTSGGISGTADKVIDSCTFGTGQFPFVPIPFVFYSASASFKYEVQDVSNAATADPYTIYIGLIGSYLIPA